MLSSLADGVARLWSGAEEGADNSDNSDVPTPSTEQQEERKDQKEEIQNGEKEEEKPQQQAEGRKQRRVRVLFASQTGTAERMSGSIAADVVRIVSPLLEREAALRAGKQGKRQNPQGGVGSNSAEVAVSEVPELVIVGGSEENDGDEGARVQSFEAFPDAEELIWEDILIFVVSTYEGGLPPASAVPFFDSLQDLANDFRRHKNMLEHVRYAILGIGDSAYDEERWCAAAKGLDMLMKSLSAKRLVDVCLADNGAGAMVETAYKQWLPELVSGLKRECVPKRARRSTGGRRKNEANGPETHTEAKAVSVDDFEDSDDDSDGDNAVADLEDIVGPEGGSEEASSGDTGKDGSSSSSSSSSAEKESPSMVTPTLRAALTKQGYKIIGSHSGVKLCRWTKAQMRGRGGCYKHTFYGIQSHRCMEMTPSLACANKCVFCWRHHSNPVGVEWRWKTDEPEMLISGAIENHQAMVKQMRGVPGVIPERFEEGMNIKHCALSLVGEPIMR
jgi:flavodoxin